MKNLLFFVFLFFCTSLVFSQEDELVKNAENSTTTSLIKPSINLYKIYTINKDTTYVDTTLSIQKEYKYNLLRKDIFGLMPFSNEGQQYNTLHFALNQNSILPNFGFTGKHFNYLEVSDIKYYNVPTPLTDLYFKTVMEQGQSVDAFLTINTMPNLNFSIAYKGLRSNGKYINNIVSSGNFRFTTSYFTKNKKYFLNAHFTGQDISNQENGGIVDVALFESSEAPYDQRDRLDVYFKDATSLLKGNRFFIDHYYKLKSNDDFSLNIFHQFNHEFKFFEYTQPTVSSRFGDAYSTNINNKTRFNQLYNKVGVDLDSKRFGKISAYIDSNTYNYFYNSVVYDGFGNIEVPNAINDKIYSLGVDYTFNYKGINFGSSINNSISDQNISSFELFGKYELNSIATIEFKYSKRNALPNLNYSLYQSDYIDYNWSNDFKNEKRNQFDFIFKSKWGNLEAQYAVINDFLYFDNITNDISQLAVKPFQYGNTINYLSVKANKEFKLGRFALDNTFLYQNVDQSDAVINVPQFVTRNTLYYTDYVFKNAMQIQTGFTFQYFSKYYANDYNPLLGEFYVQNETKIGDFPMVDFFINAKVKQARLFLKAEHFNSAWTGYDFYSAPNYPYRDFLVRFGIVWNFFK
ncbi:MAG: hypothetical protein ACJAYP_000936 [Flavobacterium sp.]|jgi:hypothetical protein